MRRFAYYNEIDPEKAAWIRELIKAQVVAPGEVDERDIKLVQPEDLRGFRQCHFFAGIAVWSYALRLAGWDDDREVWTGSCPCPSFSSAGKGQGFDDARHLWPDWVRLIRECRPATVFGEQADDAIGYGWLDLVQAEMEAENYAVGKAVLASAGVGASDIRERLYFVGEWLDNYSSAGRRERRPSETSDHQRATERHESECEPERLRDAGGMGNASLSGSWSLDRESKSGRGREEQARGSGISCWMGDSECSRQRSWQHQQSVHSAPIQTRKADRSEYAGKSSRLEYADSERCGEARQPKSRSRIGGSEEHIVHPFADALKGHWRDADWLFCTDGRWRPVEPGTFPLAHGLPRSFRSMPPEVQRMAEMAGLSTQSLARAKGFRLRALAGYGDAINAEVAKAFIESYLVTKQHRWPGRDPEPGNHGAMQLK